ncbi:uncharacterized protein LOC115099998 isoform X2 [Rhinatrema bivittatum]|uniref:uncharacterized protein LOC115099998 isoform X2 n=1 Tax=Rhinatrema bivittatum TaxID=194408 RepID=UPI0011278CA9|nr:uncharacterized protein LOC115099998 isoform X2 [Rhinatrema bivittatum]
MARNQEKQYGRLNRLWLQRQKEDGHLKEIHQKRPKLSTLHSAAEVKKWIPSIKNEIEYYLEQSQLCHYSECKIQEFQENLEMLRKEYQSYLWRLRRLDPSCKEHPWKPRGYTRKRAAVQALPACSQPGDDTSAKWLCTPVLNSDTKGFSKECEKVVGESSPRPEESSSCAKFNCSSLDLSTQDKPLIFNIKKMHPKHLWLRASSGMCKDTTGTVKEPWDPQSLPGSTSTANIGEKQGQ